MKLEIRDLKLNLNVNWKIARGATSVKDNFVVSVANGQHQGLSEVAFNIRYGESRGQILDHFDQAQGRLENSNHQYLEILDSLKIASSLRFALESAYFQFQSQSKGQELHQLLAIEDVGKNSYPTSFSIPIMSPSEAKELIQERNLTRFKALKIKINKEINADLILSVLQNYSGRIRIDGNECFEKADDVMAMLKNIPETYFSRIDFIEQPIPSSLIKEIVLLKKYCPIELMADESITDNNVSEYLCEGFSSINLKLMKTGGLRKFKEQIEAAKRLKLKIMLGCMIESTLGLSFALHFASYAEYLDLDGFLLVKDEPFKLITETDGLLRFT